MTLFPPVDELKTAGVDRSKMLSWPWLVSYTHSRSEGWNPAGPHSAHLSLWANTPDSPTPTCWLRTLLLCPPLLHFHQLSLCFLNNHKLKALQCFTSCMTIHSEVSLLWSLKRWHRLVLVTMADVRSRRTAAQSLCCTPSKMQFCPEISFWIFISWSAAFQVSLSILNMLVSQSTKANFLS